MILKKVCWLTSLIGLTLLLTACEPPAAPAVPEIRVTQPPTYTPAPTPTEITPIPTSRPSTPVPVEASPKQAALEKETLELVEQLNQIYERLTGEEEFDLNSEELSQMDGTIQFALRELNDISAKGGTSTDAQSIYSDAISGLLDLGEAGAVGSIIQTFAQAGGQMTSPATQELAAAFAGGDAKTLSAAIENFANNVSSISADQISSVATDLITAANELTAVSELVEQLLAEENLAIGLDIAQKLAQAASALENGEQADVLALLAEVKTIVDALADNLELVQLISFTVETVEQETEAVRGLETLLGEREDLRIRAVTITMIETSVKPALSADVLPDLLPTEDGSNGPVCVLGTDGNVSCLADFSAGWELPEQLQPYTGRVSAIANCNGQLLLATNSELVMFTINSDILEASPYAADGYPFKPPTRLACNSSGNVWALPADQLADNPWFFDGENWTHYSTVLQNSVGTFKFDEAWGTKWEVNENSATEDGVLIDPIPFVSHQLSTSWDILYSINWEKGLHGVAMDPGGELWFAGDALYYLNESQNWFGYEGAIGPAFTMLSNGHVIGAGPEPGTVRLFGGSTTWWELSDWPAGRQPERMATDAQGRVWAAGGDWVIVWDGTQWVELPLLATPSIGMAIFARKSGTQ